MKYVSKSFILITPLWLKWGGGYDGLKGSGAGGRNWKSIRRLLQESREEIWRIDGDEEKEMQ